MLSPLCNCWMDVESSTHILFQWRSLKKINPQIFQTSLQLLANTLFFGSLSYSDKTNTHILNATIDCGWLTKKVWWSTFLTMCLFSFFIYVPDKFTHLSGYSSCKIFFRLRLNFALFYFNYNCRTIVSYLLIISFSCILLTGGWSMN